MRKKRNIYTKIGALTFVIYLLVNRFIIEIPSVIGIPIMILGLVMIVVGFINTPKDNTKK